MTCRSFSRVTSDRPKHLPALDGLRAVAVFVVIAYHGGLAPNIPGDLGVTLFFVLSGFLITWLLLREIAATETIDFRSFYVRRTLRIMPAYFAFAGLSLIADTLLHHPWPAGLIAAAATYTVNYYLAFTGQPPANLAHTWSLAVEEQFYLLWPLCCLSLARRGRTTLRTGLVAAILGVVLWRVGLVFVQHAPPTYLYNAFDTRADALAIGCLLGVVLPSEHGTRAAAMLRRWTWFPLVVLGALLVSRVGGSSAYHYSVGMTVDAVLLAVVMVQVLGLSSTSRAWRWLDHPITRWLGRVSYPCYLWHGWGLDGGEHLARLLALVVPVPLVVRFALGYGVTVALAAASFYGLETPCLALTARLAPPQRRARPSPSGAPQTAEVL